MNMEWDSIIGAIVGIIAWALVVVGAVQYGGWGLGLVAFGLPILIHNWD